MYPKTPKYIQRRIYLWQIEYEMKDLKLINRRRKGSFWREKKTSKCRNMSHFIRKCVLEKEIYQVDLEPFRDLQGLLSNATNNINQIAKRVNSTGIIYKDDINDMKKQIEHFSKELFICFFSINNIWNGKIKGWFYRMYFCNSHKI